MIKVMSAGLIIYFTFYAIVMIVGIREIVKDLIKKRNDKANRHTE
jgi:hypothetical protein